MNRLLKNSALFVFCSLAAPFLAHAQTTPPTCSAATLNGTYALVFTGRSVSTGLALTNAYLAVGTATFDGVGAATATVTANVGQKASASVALSGTYTMPASCLGTMTLTKGDTATFTIVPYNNGANFTVTGQDGTYQFAGTGSPLPASCVTATVSGGYVFNANGFVLSSGAITGTNDLSGLLQFDGAGNVKGTSSVASNGASVSYTLTGTYTLSAACTGTATVTDNTGAGYTANFVLTSANGANFSIVAASATESFTGAAHSTFTNPGLAVANAAGVTTGTPPGSLFSVYGAGLATNTTQPNGATYPTTLGQTTVTVNGEAVPLSYISPTQINAQIPWDIVPGVATVVVKNGTALSNAAAAVVPATAAPGVFVYGANRTVAQNFPSYTLNSAAAPAPVGSTIIVYFTGGGPVLGGGALVSGKAISGALPLTEKASVTIAGTAATIGYIGITPGFVSLYQANVTIPQIGAGDHNLVLTVGGTVSNTTVISTK